MTATELSESLGRAAAAQSRVTVAPTVTQLSLSQWQRKYGETSAIIEAFGKHVIYAEYVKY